MTRLGSYQASRATEMFARMFSCEVPSIAIVLDPDTPFLSRATRSRAPCMLPEILQIA